MAQINFNAAEIETTSRDAIPTGTYEAVVTDSEMRATKSGLGMGINLTFEILAEGPAKAARSSAGSTTSIRRSRRSASGARSSRASARPWA